MRRLDFNGLDARAVFDACARRTHDIALREQLLACGPSIQIASNEYERLAPLAELYDYTGAALYPFAASLEELKGLYGRVLRDGGERPTYDAIKQLAPRGVCPQCGIGRVRTLDHYLPKSLFPELSVAPSNLVPTCRDCNFDKQEHHSHEPRDYLFHPYFDNWDNYRLIAAQVIYQPRVFLRYSIASPNNAPATVIDRAKSHFRVLNLGELYSMNAGAALAEIKLNCRRSGVQGGAPSVSEYLKMQADSAIREEPNGWKAAMYAALAADAVFSEGAYELI